MPVTIGWDNPEKTVALESIEGNWGLAETHAALDDLERMIDEVNRPIDIIVDLSNAKGSPTNLTLAAGRVDRILRGNVNRTVIVGANYYMQVFSGVLSKVVPKVIGNIQHTDTLENARALLEKQQS